ncbi:MAG TPA: hypothetical protein VMF06_15025 [Candidatus Limnocylindria bacterium]|jgi:hypothetical protein|nr:hypothetical protein [Candidatus Limnocylindria bacterium]
MLRLPTNMRRPICRFNLFFCFIAVLVGMAGCATTGDDAPKPSAGKDATTKDATKKKKDKDYALLRLYRESGVPETGGKVRFPRGSTSVLYADPSPVLDETYVKQASLVNTIGEEYVIAVQYNDQGLRILELETGNCIGKHIFIQGVWPKNRWLAAPLISQPIANGLLIFSPDCDREEAEVIVRGLNNVAIKVGNQEKPKKSEKPKESKPASELTPGGDITSPFER